MGRSVQSRLIQNKACSQPGRCWCDGPVLDAKLLVGSEPFEHLAWLGSASEINCHRADTGHPLTKRLLLAIDLVIDQFFRHPAHGVLRRNSLIWQDLGGGM